MGWVALLMVLQLSGCIGNDPSTLHQNTTESMSRCITIDHEVFLDIGQGKNRCGGKLLLQRLEVVLALGRPFKLISLLQQVGHGLGYL
jgi:starvation-inducible outer membrane lipoprotein